MFKLSYVVFETATLYLHISKGRARNGGFRMKCGGWKVSEHDHTMILIQGVALLIVLMERLCFKLQYDVFKICQEMMWRSYNYCKYNTCKLSALILIS